MPALRPRPRLHFTARTGWLNDPHGVLWADGRYHLFFQHHPHGPVWDAAISWGHAVSNDLVSWRELPPALTPEPGELGCWTGAVTLDDRGVPTLFYTRVTDAERKLGQVARAVAGPALDDWRRDPAGPVIASPPPGVEECRDPYVWRASDGWRMLLGARLASGHPALLQYTSDDLRDWQYDGVAAEDPDSRAMWECPQLFPLDGTWVLLVSADHDVIYALGDYDGRRFTPQVRGSFGNHGPAYATTTFMDRDGRRCAMSWIRETGPVDGWSGAMSLPWVLRVEGDLLVADRHPHLAGHHGDPIESPADARAVVADADIVETTRNGVAGVITTRRTV